MGNLIVALFLILLFASIIGYLLYSIKSKGTTCTSCSSCPAVKKCDKDEVKKGMLEFYSNQV